MKEELLKLIDLSAFLAESLSKMISKFGKCPECGGEPTSHFGNCSIGIAIFDARFAKQNKEYFINVMLPSNQEGQ
jgi:hypothetical protein